MFSVVKPKTTTTKDIWGQISAGNKGMNSGTFPGKLGRLFNLILFYSLKLDILIIN